MLTSADARAQLWLLCALFALTPTAAAQECEPSRQQLRNNDPWLGSFFYGGGNFYSGTTPLPGPTLNLYFDLHVQEAVSIERLWTTTYNQGASNGPADQTGNLAEVRVYMVAGTRTGREANRSLWGLTNPGSGQPEVFGSLRVTPWPEASPISDFRDAAGAPVDFTIAPGSYGVCLELIPTSWNGTASLSGQQPSVLNPSPMAVVGVSPNPGLSWGDPSLAFDNDAIQTAAWQEVDAVGDLVPRVAGSTFDSINLAVDYAPAAPTLAGVDYVGVGCYDEPGALYELFDPGPADLAGTSWQLDFTSDAFGSSYVVTAGGPAYDGVTPLTNGLDLKSMSPTTSSSTSPTLAS